jgi:6-phosphogluconolactonase
LEASGTVAAGLYPRSIVVDPSGKFAYVANCGDFERNQGDIAMYTVDASMGTLTLIGTVGAGSCPLSVALHPSGKFAYAANTGSDGGPDIEGVSMYTINPDGTLTPMGLINAGYCPSSLAVDPSGKFAYVTNHCDNTISMYKIDPNTGVLTLTGTMGI